MLHTAGMAQPEFGGVIGSTWRDSVPWWPADPSPPAGAPNVLLIVLDDVGYAQIGAYGSDIDTPNIDRLAFGGVRLANFHTTALCSPTRACLLTGRNHHSCGMGRITDLAMGYPGYYGRIPRAHGFLPEILGTAGYLSSAVGKWHLTPEDETHMAAPRDSWPCGRGFQRWYGFHGGETHQFAPALFQDNHCVGPTARAVESYHLSRDLADRAIQYLGELRSIEPEKPFFLYFATGACHSPHHAPRTWIERFQGRFDQGWDAWRQATFARQEAMGLLPVGTDLSPRPPWVPAWSDLGAEDRAVAARFMECFAAYLSYTDEQIGRVLNFIDELEERDNTLVILVSDNGASAEGGVRCSINDVRLWNGDPAGRRELRARVDELGGPTAHNNYPWGWTMAGNTPFRRWKREVHEGGVADPCILSWPGRVTARGEIRHQFAHAIDVVPTILDLAGVQAPMEIAGVAQTPIEGTSFAYLLDDPDAPGRHTTQYFEMLGSRAIVHDGWKAVTFKPIGLMYDDGLDPDAPFEEDAWELYHVDEDFSECHDLAGKDPEKLGELQRIWWDEASKHQVLPLDNRPAAALLSLRRTFGDRDRYVLWPSGGSMPERVAPNVRNCPHAVVAEVDVPEGEQVEGVLLAMGTGLGGWSFHLLDGRLRYVHSYFGRERSVVASDAVVPPGAHQLGFEFMTVGDFQGEGRLTIDGAEVGRGFISPTVPIRYSITGAGMTCGWELGPPVGDGYQAPFRCNAGLRRVVLTIGGEPHRDPEAELGAILSEQ